MVLDTVMRSHAARASIYRCEDGVFEVVYTGPISRAVFADLFPGVLRRTDGAKAIISRMDGALLLTRQLVLDARMFGERPPPGAVVASDESLEYWTAYSRAAAEAGVMRAVFSADQLGLARCWVRRQAGVTL